MFRLIRDYRAYIAPIVFCRRRNIRKYRPRLHRTVHNAQYRLNKVLPYLRIDSARRVSSFRAFW